MRRTRRPNIPPPPSPGAIVFDHTSHRVDVWDDDTRSWTPLIAYESDVEATLFVEENCRAARGARIITRKLTVCAVRVAEWRNGEKVAILNGEPSHEDH